LANHFKGYVGNSDFRGVLGSQAWYDPDAKGGTITVNERAWMIAPELAVSRSSEIWTIGGNYRAALVTHVWEKNDGQWEVVHTHISEYEP
jgi:ketosteroid isomerase-like protein